MKITGNYLKSKIENLSSLLLEYVGIDFRTGMKIKRFYRTFGFTKKRQLEFIADFATWLNDGCSPSKACLSIINAGRGDSSVHLEVQAAQSIYSALESGRPISEGMGDWFEPEVVTLFDAGQAAGATALTRVVNEYLRQAEDISAARKAFLAPMSGPLTYVGMSLAGVVAMGAGVLPQFNGILPVSSMGAATQIVSVVGVWLSSWWPLVAAIGFFIFIVASYWVRNSTSKLRLKMDNHFPLNIYKAFVAMKFLKTLGILVETRYNVFQAATELKRSSGKYLNHHLDHIIEESRLGETKLSVALDSGLLSKRLMFRLTNAADTPSEQRRKEAISIAADRSGDEAIRTLSTTRRYCVLSLWACLSCNLLLLVGSFMGIFTSLFTMSYR